MGLSRAAPLLLVVLLAGCASRGLDALVVEGPALHASLATQQVADVPLHVPRDALPGNMHPSTDRSFVGAVNDAMAERMSR